MNCVKKQLSLFGVVATVALVFAGVAEAEKLTLFVDVDEATFVGPPMGTAGPFNVDGEITGSGPKSYQSWGCISADGTANVSQTYSIPGRGMFMTQGPEGAVLAVVGGNDDFKGVRGEGDQVFTGDGFNFTIAFHLKGADDDDDDSDSDD